MSERDRIAETLQQRMVLPQFTVQTQGMTPKYGAALSVPMLGGQVGIDAGYWRPAPQAPADISGRIEYRRSF